jgi:hypothetical protein
MSTAAPALHSSALHSSAPHSSASRAVPDPLEWMEFASALRGGELTTSLLARWTGHPVGVGALERSTGPVLDNEHTGQLRTITLVTTIGGQGLTLAQATAQVRLDVLPPWARHVLETTRLPLGRTLHRAGATRRWDSTTTLHHTLPAGPPYRGAGDSVGDPARALTVRASFTLPAHGVIATVEEHFSPVLLALHNDAQARSHPGPAPAGPAQAGPAPERLIDDVDRALLDVLRRRAELTRSMRSPDGSAPPAYPVHNDLLLHELRDSFGRDVGSALHRAITRPPTTVVAPLRGPDDEARTA